MSDPGIKPIIDRPKDKHDFLLDRLRSIANRPHGNCDEGDCWACEASDILHEYDILVTYGR